MNDRRFLPRAPGSRPRPAIVSNTRSLQFDTQLSPYPAIQKDLDETYRKFTSYADIIARGRPLVPTFWDSILQAEMERTAVLMFGEPRPRMVEKNIQTPIEWSDVLRELLSPRDFQLRANGMYRCRVRGKLIEITKANYIQLITGVTEPRVQPLQNLSDEQKEERIRYKLGEYLHETHNTLVKFATTVRDSIRHLSKSSTGSAPRSNPIRQKIGLVPTIAVRPKFRSPQTLDRSSDRSRISHHSSKSISDSQSGGDDDLPEDAKRDAKRNATELSRWEISKAFENGLENSKKDGDGSVENRRLRADNSSACAQNGNNERAWSEPTATINNPVVVSRGFDTNAALSTASGQKRLRDDSASPRETSDAGSDKAKKARYETSLPIADRASYDNAGLPESRPPMPLPSVPAPNQDLRLNSDIDTESFGSDIPWRIEENKTPSLSGFTEEYADSTGSPGSAQHQRSSQEVSPTNRSDSEQRRQPVGKYSQVEENEGPAFVKSLISKGSTAAEVETEYHHRFGVPRSAGALFKRFGIKGTWSLMKILRESRQQNRINLAGVETDALLDRAGI